MLQMVADPARVAHTAGGKNDFRGRVLVEQLGFLGGLGQPQPVKCQNVDALLHQGGGFVIRVALQVAAENMSGLPGQRAVHINGKVGYRPDHFFLLDFPDIIQELLGAAYRKGGNHHVAAAAQRFVDDFCQLLGISVFRLVFPVSVSGFHHHIVSGF